MKTFITKTCEIKAVGTVICNKCGNRCDFDVGKDYASMNVSWGYHSNKDFEKHCWDLCENCYDELVATFIIPPSRFEYNLSSDDGITPIIDN